MENAQAAKERTAGFHRPPHCDHNQLPARADGATRSDPGLKSSPGAGAPTRQSEPGRPCPAGRAFLKTKCPLWRRRKGTASTLQDQAAPRSRLCMEAAHESPIQAVRKSASQAGAWGLGSEESTPGTAETSLLRRLLCLKAVSARPRSPPHSLGASPLCRASSSCGPMAALRRTAEPQGESPLRWRPQAALQGPAEAALLPEPEAEKLGGSWTMKPWQALRAVMASRTRRGSVLPGNKGDHAAAGEGDAGLPTGPGASSGAGTDGAYGQAPAEDEHAPSASPPDADDGAHGACEATGETWRGTETHRGMGDSDFLGLLTELAAEHESRWATLGRSRSEQEAALRSSSGHVLQGPCLQGAGAEAAATAERDDGGRWAGEQDLADLAENPGGQGMLMATRDLAWLSHEALGGPTVGRMPRQRGVSAVSAPEIWEPERESSASLPPRGFLEGPPSRAAPEPGLAAGARDGGGCSQLQGGPARELQPSTREAHGAMGGWDAADPGEACAERLLHRAAAEIVGAAIHRAAKRLAAAEECAGLERLQQPR